ncbi:MAG TPA: hypothetical protein VNG89_21750, partial [Vicinamibacterales bacterium]|nr:hypothetical protein [Vicinamibacterales bacterium]
MRSPAAIAAALTVPATLCLVAAALGRTAAAQPARGAAADWDYGQLAEGYTSASVGGGVDAAYRMFSTPDFPRVCVDARAGDVTSLRAAPPSIDAGVGVPIPYARLKVDAVD